MKSNLSKIGLALVYSHLKSSDMLLTEEMNHKKEITSEGQFYQ